MTSLPETGNVQCSYCFGRTLNRTDRFPAKSAINRVARRSTKRTFIITGRTDRRDIEYMPEAITAMKGWRKIISHGHLEWLDRLEQKSLSAFSFGGSGWMSQPEVSSRILSCLTDQTDFMSLLAQENLSGSSIQFPYDNSELEGATRAREEACCGHGATLPPPGMPEIKPESLRAVVCTARDLLLDASFNVEGWIRGKAERAFREKLAAAFIAGDGNGRPLGILDPKSDIQVCDTNSRGKTCFNKRHGARRISGAGRFLDACCDALIGDAMIDALGRPIWTQFPSSDGRVSGGRQIAGSPVRAGRQMSAVQPDPTAILFADLSALYLLTT